MCLDCRVFVRIVGMFLDWCLDRWSVFGLDGVCLD